MKQVRAAVVGAGGYAGAEAVSILLRHRGAEVVGLFASARREKEAGGGSTMADLFPRFRGRCDLAVTAASVEAVMACRPDAVFLATPHEASLDLAPELASRGAVVLDLSAAYRLKDASLYPAFYGFEHSRREALAGAVYGLVESFRAEIAGASLIAVPGCYPTSVILPTRPLVKAGAVRPGARVIVDSVSGVSGAGRGMALGSLFCEVSLRAYGVMSHRHGPEMEAYAGVPIVFTPQVAAFERGILSTIHIELADGWDGAKVGALLREAYRGERFVRLLPEGVWPGVGDVRGTNCCDIALKARDGHLIISSAIDNLVKGAAGQAVQCMNVRFGLDEAEGLWP
ncbi:MAG: N-acetyl-gamma-glutamyl-phosphate reductase [Phycisphaeraceae bacterium]|nr:MAG: N-acetyl-gamma-glutamyl-phosphate reductase [Phycisphaeraceae bacterium]